MTVSGAMLKTPLETAFADKISAYDLPGLTALARSARLHKALALAAAGMARTRLKR